MNYSINHEKNIIIQQIYKFVKFVQFIDKKDGYISFRDSNGYLGKEEDYKSKVAEGTRKELNFSAWDESWIGSGKILECARNAISKASNLVNSNQQIDFKNRLDPNHIKFNKNAERVLYDIYCNKNIDESLAFDNAVKIFGHKYDTIAFLFFIKDDSRFLPISPGNFEKGLILLIMTHQKLKN